MFMSESRKQLGFTLIELVMVIVILGILAATALPKLTNVSGAARYSKMQAVLGAMKSTGAMVHSKAVVSGVENGTVTVDGEIINVQRGYIVASDLLVAAGVDSADFTNIMTWNMHTIILWENACIIAYTDAVSGNRPVGVFYGIINATNNSC